MSESATAGARLRLDYVSPLPPVRSGISDYSAALLPHLEPLCDLRVVRGPSAVGPLTGGYSRSPSSPIWLSSQASMNGSMSPSRTLSASPTSRPVRWSLTMRYGCST